MAKVVRGKKLRVLVIADAVANTGFATVTHGILDNLYKDYEFTVLGLNYRGQKHTYDYEIITAATDKEILGLNKLANVYMSYRPDVIFIINDPWIVLHYIKAIKENLSTNVLDKVVVYTPIDGSNIKSEFVKPMNDVNSVVAYTEFGLSELRNAGLEMDSTYIIPHGFDSSIFEPVSKEECKKVINIDSGFFVFGNINRNQARKRLDLTMMYFKEWVEDKPENVKLYLHCSVKDQGWDILQLADYLGITDRLLLTSTKMTSFEGIPRTELKYVYNSFDVQISTTHGEGWGLTNLEGMACGVPQIVPDYSALGEWPRGAVEYVPVSSYYVNTNGLNTIGGVPDKDSYLKSMDKLYYDSDYREELSRKSLELASNPKFSWREVSSSFSSIFRKVAKDG